MVVNNHMAKLNDNNCRNVATYIGQGLSVTDAFCMEVKRTRNNPKHIYAYEYRNDKWFWLFKFLDSEQNMIQYTESC